MSPRTGRPKAVNPKNIDLKVRIDAETNKALEAYAEKNAITKAEAVRTKITGRDLAMPIDNYIERMYKLKTIKNLSGLDEKQLDACILWSIHKYSKASKAFKQGCPYDFFLIDRVCMFANGYYKVSDVSVNDAQKKAILHRTYELECQGYHNDGICLTEQGKRYLREIIPFADV